jgi:methionyl-tRNA formyltransferase
VGVVTAPDRKAGRGQKLTASDIKQYALEKGLPVLQPANLKSPAFLDELRSLRANLQVVVAFRMLPEAVWNMPELGTINLHASLLPQYRGAAPINWAIIHGEKETGVTTFLIEHQIDTGDLLFQDRVAIGPDDTAGDLHDRLMRAGANLVLRTVHAIEQHTVQPIPQVMTDDLKKAPKIFKEDCQLDWYQPVEQIYDRIRGLSPYPAAFTLLKDKLLKIYRARPTQVGHQQTPGFADIDQQGQLRFYGADGYLTILELQLEGKRRMTTEEFLRGFNLQD